MTGCMDSPITSSSKSSSSSNSNPTNKNTSQEEYSITSEDSEPKKLDILIVLPATQSQTDSKLSTSLSLLLLNDNFQSIDWQIAFTSEDPTQNNNTNIPSFFPLKNRSGNIKEPDSNKDIYTLTPELQTSYTITELLMETMTSSRNGQKMQPLISLIQSIGKTENQTFFRQDALLAILVLNKGQDNEESTTPLQVIESIHNHLGSSKDFATYGIITKVGDTQCAEDQTNDITNFSYAVSTFITETKGIIGSICEEDYNPLLTQIGSDIENKLGGVGLNEIELRHTSIVEGTIELSFDPSENAPQSWQFDSQTSKITFDPPSLKDNTTVHIFYDYYN